VVKKIGRFVRPFFMPAPFLLILDHMKNQPIHRRLGFALQGIASAWRTESSFRTQCIAALGVIAVLAWRRPPLVWWVLLLMLCGMVLAAELFNSALEAALDHLHPESHHAIRIAKDCAAGAVLLLSVSAAGVFAAFLVDTCWP
jgi:undecaprenol kinase